MIHGGDVERAPNTSTPAVGVVLDGLSLAFVWTLTVMMRAKGALEWWALLGVATLTFVGFAMLHRLLVPFGKLERAVFVGLLQASAPLMLFGLLLVRGTHHRPLGSVTFAVVGGAISMFSIAIAWRCLALEARRFGKVAWPLCRLIACASVGWVMLELYRLVPGCRSALGNVLWAFALISILVMRKGKLLPNTVTSRVPVWLALSIGLVVCGGGLGLLAARPALVEAVLTPIEACGAL